MKCLPHDSTSRRVVSVLEAPDAWGTANRRFLLLQAVYVLLERHHLQLAQVSNQVG